MAIVFSPFLGKGGRFPFSFDPITGGVRRASSENYYLGNPKVQGKELEKIKGALDNILSTALDVRFFLPSFGTRLQQLLFEPNDDVFADMARVYIAEAISRWEKRIRLLSIDILTDVNDLNYHTSRIVINYIIISTQVKGNFIYPFVRRL